MPICHTCQRIARRDAGQAPTWDNILRTAHWDLVHAYDSALPGWLVLVARQHVASIAELSREAAAELGPLLRCVSIALEEVSGCGKTYVAQFAESHQHPHVHFHIVPRKADCPADRLGPKAFGYLGASDSERVDEETMTQLALDLRERLSALLSGKESA